MLAVVNSDNKNEESYMESDDVRGDADVNWSKYNNIQDFQKFFYNSV